MATYEAGINGIVSTSEDRPTGVYHVVNKTYEDKCSKRFWIAAHGSLVVDNPIVAMKFCYVLHKLLRESHPGAIPYCEKNWGKVMDLGKIWAGNNVKYGNLIPPYAKFLYQKIKFHEKFNKFRGNLFVLPSDLDSFKNDPVLYEKVVTKIVEHFVQVLDVIQIIIDTFESQKTVVACLVSPLLPCIEEASRLQEICRWIFFDTPLDQPHKLDSLREQFVNQIQPRFEDYSNNVTYEFFKTLPGNSDINDLNGSTTNKVAISTSESNNSSGNSPSSGPTSSDLPNDSTNSSGNSPSSGPTSSNLPNDSTNSPNAPTSLNSANTASSSDVSKVDTNTFSGLQHTCSKKASNSSSSSQHASSDNSSSSQHACTKVAPNSPSGPQHACTKVAPNSPSGPQHACTKVVPNSPSGPQHACTRVAPNSPTGPQHACTKNVNNCSSSEQNTKTSTNNSSTTSTSHKSTSYSENTSSSKATSVSASTGTQTGLNDDLVLKLVTLTQEIEEAVQKIQDNHCTIETDKNRKFLFHTPEVTVYIDPTGKRPTRL